MADCCEKIEMAVDWNKMTVNQLRAELIKRGLEKSGPKSELVKRLTEDDNKGPEEKAKQSDGGAESGSLFDSRKLHEETSLDSKQDTKSEKSTPSKTESGNVGTKAKTGDSEQEKPKEEKPVEKTIDEKKEQKEFGEKTAEPSSEKTEKSDGKKSKKGPKKWVAIMENEKSDMILEELEKINKLECLKGRSREIFQVHETHKIRLFPVVPSDLAEPLILDALKQSISSLAKFNCSDPQNEPKGLLELTFPKRSKLEEFLPKLSQYKESVNVVVDKKENEWKDQYKQAAAVPEHASDLEKLRLFAPSLPQSITEDEMWDYFPRAKEILLVPATPRKHAYITFVNEESMLQSVEELNARGPQKDDFRFCRLLRLSDVVKLLPRRARRALKEPVKQSTDGASVDHKTGQSGTAIKAQKATGLTKPKALVHSGAKRARVLLMRRRARGDRGGYRTSYWRAPGHRTSGHGLESAFSQLQQPSSLVNPQAQQSLHVLDTLLNTLGQMGGDTHTGGGSSLNTTRMPEPRPDIGPMQPKNRYTSNGEKRLHSMDEMEQDFGMRHKRPRRRYGRLNQRQTDDMPRKSYGNMGSYNSGMMNMAEGTSSMNFSSNDNLGYGRSDDMGSDRMYNTFNTSNRFRDTMEPQQNVYGMGGQNYRQDNYY